MSKQDGSKRRALYTVGFKLEAARLVKVEDGLKFYNHRRLRSTLGYISPMEFEENWHAGQAKTAA